MSLRSHSWSSSLDKKTVVDLQLFHHLLWKVHSAWALLPVPLWPMKLSSWWVFCTYPDPSKPFMVMVHTSESGVGAYSTLWEKKPKLQAMAFFAREFKPIKRTYDIRKCELLVVKLTFKRCSLIIYKKKKNTCLYTTCFCSLWLPTPLTLIPILIFILDLAASCVKYIS